MGRRTTSTSYVTPIAAGGALEVEDGTTFGRGSYTLLAGTRYFFVLGGADAPFNAAHFQWSSPMVITSLTIEDSNFPPVAKGDGTGGAGDVSDFSTAAADWIDEDPSTAFVGVVGAGVSQTNGVVAATGGAQGGCMFHVVDTGARRTRVNVLVGATGGEMRCAVWAKE